MIRVAFTLIGGKNWTGGYNYLLNLLTALGKHQAGTIAPVLFVPADAHDEATVFSALPGVQVVRSDLLGDDKRRAQLAQALAWGRVPAMQRLFAGHRIDVVFEAAQFFGWRLGLPAIAWIPDFQHRVLPHLFSKPAWIKREIGFRAQVAGGRTIMLSSDDARQACERYYPATRGRTRTVHFAVPAAAAPTPQAARAVADSHGLPRDFVFLPNQFWRHKNHLLVLDALAILKSRGIDIVIAASGKQHDPRAPAHFDAFQQKLAAHGLQSSMRLLGLVPYAHLPALMASCRVMLNPSLFEGWSTTVEEARAFGTPMLLSDIDVHREQMGDAASYFVRDSAASLADALVQALASAPAFDDPARAAAASAAQQASTTRVATFAGDFARLAQDVSATRARA